MSDASATAPVSVGVGKRTRRTHHKSRHGCKNCKLRRIKCDETKPTCENCIKFRIPCSFNSNPSPPSDASPPAQDVPRRRGRPRKDWLAATAQPPSADHSPGNNPDLAAISPDTLSEQPPPYLIGDHSLNITDLQLLHNYMYKASMNIANAKGPDQFWSIDCPKLGFAHPHTLHLILTYSALHMSRHETDPERQQQLHDEAVLHFATALQQTRLELQHRPDWRPPVDRLRHHICSLMCPADFDRRRNDDVCRLSLTALEEICPPCEAMWGKTPDEPLERDQEYSVYAWLYRLDDNFIRCLERKEQIALVVFAYFALLLKELEVYWFMQGWAEHIILGTDQFLDEEHKRWLEWPKEQLGLIEITIKKYTESMVLK
ncbi:hypothetical protein N8I77_009484 [Diaporthe amygdali]|uniref:Zn(2)-C6 fungal-type domain-containing protein n=1 Tax=Phomopsis amygdali TaxID=1214568 RepID=A0AAD9SCR1_PHOAM|nr:hypothetical protein N8I77_009484 [Diaporthe amygdali]